MPSPEIFVFPRGWFAFKFANESDVARILAGVWKWNFSDLLLKRWTPLFDPRIERYDLMLVWVKLPNFPFEFWSLEFFKLFGNALGTFMEADLFF